MRRMLATPCQVLPRHDAWLCGGTAFRHQLWPVRRRWRRRDRLPVCIQPLTLRRHVPVSKPASAQLLQPQASCHRGCRMCEKCMRRTPHAGACSRGGPLKRGGRQGMASGRVLRPFSYAMMCDVPVFTPRKFSLGVGAMRDEGEKNASLRSSSADGRSLGYSFSIFMMKWRNSFTSSFSLVDIA